MALEPDGDFFWETAEEINLLLQITNIGSIGLRPS